VLILYIGGIISFPFFIVSLLLFWIFSNYLTVRISPVYSFFSGIAPEIDSLHGQIRHLESTDFASSYISGIKKSILSRGQATVSREIFLLKNILKRFDYRLNIYVFIFLNAFLLWDLRQLQALSAWRARNNATVSKWFEAIARLETLIGLSSLAFNEPAFSFPVLTESFFTLEGVSIGHPLISGRQRVDNSFSFSGTGRVALITGSNMAGKSTFLRSLGLNIVLAQMGSVVCAESFRFSPVRLMTSMRVADNLAENTSTFYAELKKLQSIIEAVNRGERVFILLDEMLRGTNSNDRHVGSEAMIRQLIRNQAVAVIATHDIELARPAGFAPESMTNYYFDVQVANDELYFDYKLKPGICQSLNASLLMKKIGIDLDN
jgi:DNA mismatch repair ATPase MutS